MEVGKWPGRDEHGCALVLFTLAYLLTPHSTLENPVLAPFLVRENYTCPVTMRKLGSKQNWQGPSKNRIFVIQRDEDSRVEKSCKDQQRKTPDGKQQKREEARSLQSPLNLA